jgi:hypothetical protein
MCQTLYELAKKADKALKPFNFITFGPGGSDYYGLLHIIQSFDFNDLLDKWFRHLSNKMSIPSFLFPLKKGEHQEIVMNLRYPQKLTPELPRDKVRKVGCTELALIHHLTCIYTYQRNKWQNLQDVINRRHQTNFYAAVISAVVQGIDNGMDEESIYRLMHLWGSMMVLNDLDYRKLYYYNHHSKKPEKWEKNLDKLSQIFVPYGELSADYKEYYLILYRVIYQVFLKMRDTPDDDIQHWMVFTTENTSGLREDTTGDKILNRIIKDVWQGKYDGCFF